jgi:hypothetical protein
VTAAERLAAMLRESGANEANTRRVVQALENAPVRLAEELDHWNRLVRSVGPAEAARTIVEGYSAGLTG